MNHKSQKIIALGGATGSGKTALALALARKYPQLVILSADSRQVYKYLDIGSAKVGEPGVDTSLTGQPEPVWYVENIPQFLIDIAEPGSLFTLIDYQKEAYRLISACWDKGKIPLLVGGTGLYLQSVIEGYAPSGEIDLVLRHELEQKPLEMLQAMARKQKVLVPLLDRGNKRRIIRALEKKSSIESNQPPLDAEIYTFVLTRPWEEQRALADPMVQERLDLGLVTETKQLLAQGINQEWLHGMGLSYRLVIEMLEGKFPETELNQRMTFAFCQLMRRQRTWFNRMPYAYKMNQTDILQALSKLLNDR